MNDTQKPSVLWSIVGIGLPAVVAVVSFILAMLRENRAGWIAVGVIFTFVALQGVMRVRAAVKKDNSD